MSLETTEAQASDATATPAPTPVTIVETPESSIDDDLAAVWDKAQADDSGESEAEAEGPIRGPDGKFAKRDTEQSAAEDGSEEESADQPEEVEAETTVEAPDTWSAEMQEKFKALPPEFSDLKEFVAQREQETGDALARVGQEVVKVEQFLQQFEPFDRVARQHQEAFQRRGIHPAQAFDFLLNAQEMLDKNPLGGIVQIGRSYGFDLAPLLQSAGVQVQQPQQAHQQIEPYVAALQSKIQQLESKMTAQEQAAYQAEEQRLSATIAEFANGKPYFDEVRPVMAALLQGGQADDLAAAYDMAINASPKVRARIQQDAKKESEAKRTAEQKAKAESAKKSTAVNVKSGTANTATPKTMDDTLEEIARRHYG